MRTIPVLLVTGIAGIVLAGLCGAAAGAVTDHSLSFDGVSQYVAVGDPVQVTDGPFSLEAWVWMESIGWYRAVLSNRLGTTGYKLALFPGVGDVPNVGLVLNGALVAFNELNGATIQQWVHLAVTWAGVGSGELKLYANGVLLTTYTNTTPIAASPTNLRIGMSLDGGDYFDGLIDDVRIWGTVLDQATIAEWMLKPVDASHPNYSDLRAYWKLDEGAGQIVASEVNSPTCDGSLGPSGATEPEDPLWTDTVSPVPVEQMTLGRLKWGWYLDAR